MRSDSWGEEEEEEDLRGGSYLVLGLGLEAAEDGVLVGEGVERHGCCLSCQAGSPAQQQRSGTPRRGCCLVVARERRGEDSFCGVGRARYIQYHQRGEQRQPIRRSASRRPCAQRNATQPNSPSGKGNQAQGTFLPSLLCECQIINGFFFPGWPSTLATPGWLLVSLPDPPRERFPLYFFWPPPP